MNTKIRESLSARIVEVRDTIESIHADRLPSKKRDCLFKAIEHLNAANNLLFVEEGISEDCRLARQPDQRQTL